VEFFMLEYTENAPMMRYWWTCSDRHLDRFCDFVSDAESKALLCQLVDQVRAYINDGQPFGFREDVVVWAIKAGIVKHFDVKTQYGFELSELLLPTLAEFVAPPPFPLEARDGMHYLHCTATLQGIALMGWLYTGQNALAFRRAVRAVGAEYRAYSRHSCGFGGEIEKLATRFRYHLDLALNK
jgi:hypothetical protein